MLVITKKVQLWINNTKEHYNKTIKNKIILIQLREEKIKTVKTKQFKICSNIILLV